jgi:hypothetical protein
MSEKRIQSRNKYDDDGLKDLDPYFTCFEAIQSLILLEGDRMPRRILEPAAGDGAIVRPLLAAGHFVIASDIHDYGLEGCGILDYLTASPLPHVDGVVTNPPYKWAQAFATKALTEVPYVALLVRTNWLMDSERRGRWLDVHEPTRQWLLLPRLPMMHRYGWEGKKAPSNTPYCWAVWQRGAPREFPQRVYWKELLGLRKPDRVGTTGSARRAARG